MGWMLLLFKRLEILIKASCFELKSELVEVTRLEVEVGVTDSLRTVAVHVLL